MTLDDLDDNEINRTVVHFKGLYDQDQDLFLKNCKKNEIILARHINYNHQQVYHHEDQGQGRSLE